MPNPNRYALYFPNTPEVRALIHRLKRVALEADKPLWQVVVELLEKESEPTL